MTITSLETHFPAVLANTIIAQAPPSPAGEQRTVSIHIAPNSAAAEQPYKPDVPMRVLTIALEPASLGAVTVRMKMSGSNIDLDIKVESVDALQSLTNTRDQLVDAIKATGCAVDSCTIQVGSASGSSDSSQTAAFGQRPASSGPEAESRANGGDQGARHGARNDDPGAEPRNRREERPSGVAPSHAADRLHGVYL
jgi:flagellar hook-length control protein FliK